MRTPEPHASAAPMVDVVVPTLGGSPYLAEALESVFAQTLPSWRVTVAENGPASEKVAAALSDYLPDERVRHHVLGKTITMSQNWTRAIRYAEAPYVAMLHDDDRWHPDYLARRAEVMEKHPTSGFVFGGYRAIDENGTVFRTVIADLPPGLHHRSAILPILYENCLVTPPTALVRTSAYAAVGAEYREILMMDYEMWLRLAARFDVSYLAAADADYRFHSAQNTAKTRLRIGQGQLEVIAATEHLPVPTSVRRRTRAKAHLLCAIDSIELGKRRDALRHLRSALRSYPRLLLTPGSSARMVLALLAIALGEPGRRAFGELRFRRFRVRMATEAFPQSRS